MYNDSLYRVSFKCLIRDDQGRVLVIKERRRSTWDLPGGGIEHGETIENSIRRELHEEVSYEGNFSYEVVKVDDPVKLMTRDVWQFKIITKVIPESMQFGVGEESDEIAFMNPETLKDSEHETESRIYDYSLLA